MLRGKKIRNLIQEMKIKKTILNYSLKNLEKKLYIFIFPLKNMLCSVQKAQREIHSFLTKNFAVIRQWFISFLISLKERRVVPVL